MIRRAAASLAALVLVGLSPSARAAGDAPAPAPSPPLSRPAFAPATDDVHAELERQAAALDELKASLDEERRAREAPPPVRVSGFVQTDWIVHDQQSQNEVNGSTGQLLNDDRFTLRRGHLRVDAERSLFSAALEIDANTTSGAQVRPIEADVSIRWPEKPSAGGPTAMLTLGLQRIPFGFEVQEVDYVRPFLERATMLQALFPGEFDLGARLRGSYRFVDWAIAAMNGSPIGSRSFPDLDPTRTKDLVGRLGVDLEIVDGVRFQAGTSFETGLGFHTGTPTTKDTIIWVDQNGDGIVQPNEIQVVPGQSSSLSQTFQRWAIGGDARLLVRLPVVGELAFRGEIVRAQNLDRGLEVADPVGAGHDLREVGWSIGATQEITKWSMIGARYDRYDPDADASDQRGLNLVPVDRSYGVLAVMAMARYEKTARLLLEYDARTNSLGLDASGAPTTLAANTLTLRGQVVF